MRESTEETLLILRAIVDAMTNHHEAIKTTAKEVPGGVYWTLKTHPDDYGKVAGRAGVHIKALNWLMIQLGRANNELYQFSLLQPDPGERQPPSRIDDAKTYEPSAARELLEWTAAAALDANDDEIDVCVDQVPSDRRLTFRFGINAGPKYAALIAPPADLETPSLLEILRTLWSAWAHKEGVKFIIEAVPQPLKK